MSLESQLLQGLLLETVGDKDDVTSLCSPPMKVLCVFIPGVGISAAGALVHLPLGARSPSSWYYLLLKQPLAHGTFLRFIEYIKQ